MFLKLKVPVAISKDMLTGQPALRICLLDKIEAAVLFNCRIYIELFSGWLHRYRFRSVMCVLYTLSCSIPHTLQSTGFKSGEF